MQRRTKIVATLGPSTETPEAIEQLVLGGVNVVRLNFSHGSVDEHKQRAELVRTIAARHGRVVAILGDLQGPKIRIARFAEGKVKIEKGQPFILDAELAQDAGNSTCVGIDYKELVNDSESGDILLLDDGRLELEVQEVIGQQIHCRVLIGGILSNNKGINRKGGGLSASALTDKDKQDIKSAAAIDVDFLAVSFPRTASDMEYARSLAEEAGCRADLIAKIERAETVADVNVLDDIIRASDGVMVARGDLGVEIGDAELIGVQKHIISRARKLNKFVITATQMMESMISSPMPTRAEVFDVANAVLDGTDAVMLSAETAAGDYPTETVEAMVRIILGAEKQPLSQKSGHRINETFTRVDESIALAAMYTANHLSGVKAIISITETGATPLIMSRIRSGLPIYAFTNKQKTQNRMAIYRGVEPMMDSLLTRAELSQSSIEKLLSTDAINNGDLVIMTSGVSTNNHGSMTIVTAGNQPD